MKRVMGGSDSLQRTKKEMKLIGAPLADYIEESGNSLILTSKGIIMRITIRGACTIISFF
jgi:hypothetical protein